MSESVIPVIDAHCHVFPELIAEKSKAAVGQFYGLPMYTAGTAAHLRAERTRLLEAGGRKFRIVGQLVCSPAVTPHQTGSINRFLASLVRNDTALTGFGTLHPGNADHAAILGTFRASGLRGLKLHADFQQFDMDDPSMYEIYREAAHLGLPVLFHMGDKTLEHSHPRRLRRVLEEIPELTVIAAHMGGYSHWEEAFGCLEPSGRLYFDLSSTLQLADGALVRAFLEKFGDTQFFFGSDFPMWDPYSELECLLRLDLPEETLQKLLYGNISAFLQG